MIPESVTKEGKLAARSELMRNHGASDESVWAPQHALQQERAQRKSNGLLHGLAACAKLLGDALMRLQAVRYTVTV